MNSTESVKMQYEHEVMSALPSQRKCATPLLWSPQSHRSDSNRWTGLLEWTTVIAIILCTANDNDVIIWPQAGFDHMILYIALLRLIQARLAQVMGAFGWKMFMAAYYTESSVIRTSIIRFLNYPNYKITLHLIRGSCNYRTNA